MAEQVEPIRAVRDQTSLGNECTLWKHRGHAASCNKINYLVPQCSGRNVGQEKNAAIALICSVANRALDISKTASGCYRLEWPRVRLTELQMQVGSDLFIGYGATQDDGRLLLELSSGAKQMRVSGALAQLAVEENAVP